MFNIIFIITILLSLLTGSVSITLLSLYHQFEITLIIITCASFIYALTVIAKLFINEKHKPNFYPWLQSLCLICQLVIWGAIIEFFNFTVKNDSFNLDDDLHNRLLIVFESSLLSNLLVNGVFLGYMIKKIKPITNRESDNDDNSIGDVSHDGIFDPKILNSDNLNNDHMINADPVPINKFIPYKDSAQTLTPDLNNNCYSILNVQRTIFTNEVDIVNEMISKNSNNFNSNGNNNINISNKINIEKNKDNLNWMMQRIQSSKFSEDQSSTSNASVIKHKLGDINIENTHELHEPSDNKSIKSRLRSLSNTSGSKKLQSLKFNGLRFKFNSNKKINKRTISQNDIKNSGNNSLIKTNQLNKNSINLNKRYLTRLSTISDLPKSFGNFLNNSASNNNNSITSPTTDVRQSIFMASNRESNRFSSFDPSNSLSKSPQMVEERQAIERINDALLPSCLHIHKKIYSTNSINNNDVGIVNNKNKGDEKNNDHNDNNKNILLNNGNIPNDNRDYTPNSIIRPESRLIPDVDSKSLRNISSDNMAINGLNDLSQIPNLKIDTNLAGNYSDDEKEDGLQVNKNFNLVGNENTGYLNNITLAMWENDKVNVLRKLSESQNSMLLSPFQFQDDLKMDSITESHSLELKPEFKQNDGNDGKNNDNHNNILYPNANTLSIIQKNSKLDNQEDTISQLDEYFNTFNKDTSTDPVEILENSLRQQDFSLDNAFTNEINKTTTISKEYSKNNVSHKHSPTKSIVSLLSGSGSLQRQKSQSFNISTPVHTRTNSQIQYIFSQGSNNNGNNNVQFITSKNYNYNNPNFFNNSNINTSTQSSPTRQRFKKIGKKLSLSNLSDKNDFDYDSSNAIFEHNRGRSIDFSYLHQIQNQSSSQHSPKKSISEMSLISGSQSNIGIANCGNNFVSDTPTTEKRKTSFSRKLKNASQMFYKHKNTTIVGSVGLPNDKIEVNSTFTGEDTPKISLDSRQVSNQESSNSENNYPTNVVSEYDKEKWNTLKNLKVIDDQGHAAIPKGN